MWSLRTLLEKHFKITANIFFLYLKILNLFDAYIQVISCAINVVIHCLTSFFFPFPFLEKYTKRQEQFCYFLMKTLLTLKYPVLVTNSNSKVHPFIDMMWRKPISARIPGKQNIQFGEKPISWFITTVSILGWCELGERNLPVSFEQLPPTWNQTLIQ